MLIFSIRMNTIYKQAFISVLLKYKFVQIYCVCPPLKSVIHNWERFCPPRNIWRCLEIFFFHDWAGAGGGCCYCHWLGRGLGRCHTRPRKASSATKNYLVQNITVLSLRNPDLDKILPHHPFHLNYGFWKLNLFNFIM